MNRTKPMDFVAENERLTREVLDAIGHAGRHGAVIAEAPPGAGKSTLTASVAKGLTDKDRSLQLAIVTQTNEQGDDLVASLVGRFPQLGVARMVGSTSGPSRAIHDLATASKVLVVNKVEEASPKTARVIVSTARKWQFERSRLQIAKRAETFPVALIDEAYQMRSDGLLGIAHLFDTLFCVGDPGQLDPFTTVDDSLWKGLPYSPSRAALATLRAFRPNLSPMRLPTSWRLPPSAAGVISKAFYPTNNFAAGTLTDARELALGAPGARAPGGAPADEVLDHAAKSGWCYLEMPERFTPRTDVEVATALASLVARLLARGATVRDERTPGGRVLDADRVAVIAAHNDQVHAVRHALDRAGVPLDKLVISTANKIQGREYDVVFVWHPLAGRRDATAFHLEAGRMCVMLSRHRQACIVVGRAGAERLLAEFPDTDPVFLEEAEKFPDGWEANHSVLQHLATCRVQGRRAP